jgi:hypothetical protein
MSNIREFSSIINTIYITVPVFIVGHPSTVELRPDSRVESSLLANNCTLLSHVPCTCVARVYADADAEHKKASAHARR